MMNRVVLANKKSRRLRWVKDFCFGWWVCRFRWSSFYGCSSAADRLTQRRVRQGSGSVVPRRGSIFLRLIFRPCPTRKTPGFFADLRLWTHRWDQRGAI